MKHPTTPESEAKRVLELITRLNTHYAQFTDPPKGKQIARVSDWWHPVLFKDQGKHTSG